MLSFSRSSDLASFHSAEPTTHSSSSSSLSLGVMRALSGLFCLTLWYLAFFSSFGTLPIAPKSLYVLRFCRVMPPINPTRRENESIFFIFYLPDKPQQLRRYILRIRPRCANCVVDLWPHLWLISLSLSLSRSQQCVATARKHPPNTALRCQKCLIR